MVPIPPSWRSRLAFAAGWTVIAAAAAWLVINLAGWSSTTPFDFDAKKYYIPYAQRFLAEGWAFFADPKSVHVPPFSFLFAALTGAELGLQKAIGIGLSLATLLMVARMAMVVHSPAAGVCAAALFALTPLLPPYLSSGSVEPLYVFLFTAWLALLVEGAQRNATGWFVAAGIALGLAALTRATLVYFIPVVIVAALVLRWRRLGMRTLAKGLLTAHILALALVAPVIVRNLLLHGLPAISTGAGIALYAGHHANTWGFDPGYFNVAFDFGILGKDGWWHLDVEMDRLLAVMAKKVVASYEWMFLLKLYAIKATSFLFVSNQEWIAPVAMLRGWRIAELGLAALGAVAVLHRPIALLILAVTAFQFVAHVPVLYALRYSVVALEIPLILFAAIGLARASAWPWQRQLAGAGMLAGAILGGTLLARNPTLLQMNLEEHVPVVRLAERSRTNLGIAPVAGLREIAPGSWRTTADSAKFDIDLSAERLSPQHAIVLVLDAALDQPRAALGTCRVTYHFRGTADAQFATTRALERNWNADGVMRTLKVGLSEHVRVYEPGVLRIEFHCGPNTRIDIARLALVAPEFSADMMRRHLSARGVLKPD